MKWNMVIEVRVHFTYTNKIKLLFFFFSNNHQFLLQCSCLYVNPDWPGGWAHLGGSHTPVFTKDVNRAADLSNSSTTNYLHLTKLSGSLVSRTEGEIYNSVDNMKGLHT